MGANKNPTFFRYEPIHFILSASKSNAIFETKYLVFCCQNLKNQLLHGAHPHFCKPLFLKIQFCLNRYTANVSPIKIVGKPRVAQGTP